MHRWPTIMDAKSAKNDIRQTGREEITQMFKSSIDQQIKKIITNLYGTNHMPTTLQSTSHVLTQLIFTSTLSLFFNLI